MRTASAAAAFGVALLAASPSTRADETACFAEQRLQTLRPESELRAVAQACSALIAAGGERQQRALYNRSLATFLTIVQRRIGAAPGATSQAGPSRADLGPAFDDLDRAIAAPGPLRASALRLRATYNQFVGLYGDALADLTAAIGLEPDDPVAYQQRALEWERQNDATAALADYERALALDPRAAAAALGRGRLLRRIGDVTGALRDFATAAASPGALLATALVEKSRAEARLGDLTGAYQDMAKAAEVETFASTKALRFAAAGDLARRQIKANDAARKFYVAALALDPNSWRARLGLADIALDEGDRAEAARRYEAIIQATQALPGLAERALARARLWRLRNERWKRADASEFQILTGAAAHDGVRREAVVLGNGRYETLAGLPNAPRDAMAVAAALHEAGFESVAVLENFRTEQIGAILEHVRERARRADVMLIYYAGHGLESGAVNYLLPVDLDADRPGFLTRQTLLLRDLSEAAAAARRGAVVVVDACRDDPVVEATTLASTRNGGPRAAKLHPGLAPAGAQRANLLTLFSTQAGQAAIDGDDLDSPFARAFLAELGRPERSLGDVARSVQAAVASATAGKQVPAFYGEPANIKAPLQSGARQLTAPRP